MAIDSGSGFGGLMSAGNLWARSSRWVIMSPAIWVLALADLGGSIAGYSYWYGSTILAAPWYYWVLVPDCPLAAMLMGAALLGYHFRRGWDLLGALAVGMSIKYGLWAVVSWTIEFSHGGPFSLEGVTMAATHLLLLMQGLMLLWFLRYRLVSVVITSLFLIANDLADYVAGQYPRLPETVGVRPMMGVAVGTTAIIVMLYWSMAWISVRRAHVEARVTQTDGALVESGAVTKG